MLNEPQPRRRVRSVVRLQQETRWSQLGALDGAHRSGGATGNHQDSPAALLLPGRTAHPLGPVPHPGPTPGLALAEPVQQRSGPIARPAAPLLTTTTASDHPPHYPIAWPTRARLAPQCSPAAVCQAALALCRHCGPSTSLWRGYHTLCPAGLERTKATPPPFGSSHPWLPRVARSFR